MSLINSSYFKGDLDIPNLTDLPVLDFVNSIVDSREPEYLNKSLGYELFKAFNTGIQVTSPDQRYIDLLLGADYRWNGRLKRWPGFVSVTDEQATLQVNASIVADFFFTVGVTIGAPVNGDDTYNNTSLAGENYNVNQRDYGPLEKLKEDASNTDTADIEILPSGGFRWLNGIKFADRDKFQIVMDSITLDVSGIPKVPQPVSAIADYCYCAWIEDTMQQVTNQGIVQSKSQNSEVVSSSTKYCSIWNRMVDKTILLYEFLTVNASTYPEFGNYFMDCEINDLLTKRHAGF